MSGTVADRKRLVRITAGNLRQNHIYINGHYDFFPSACVGGPKKAANGTAATFEIYLSGLRKTIHTDIGADAKTGKPRHFFRGRTWVREFFEFHKIKTGDVLAFERKGSRRYRLYPYDAKTVRNEDWRRYLDAPPPGRGPTVLELFAGCGGFVLGFKRAGFRTVLANSA